MKLFISILLLLSFNFNIYADKLKIVTNNWYPFVSQNNSEKGIISEIVEAVLKDQNIDYQIVYKPFDLGYEQTKNTIYDLTYPYFKTNDRENEMIYSNPLIEVENVLFFNKLNYNLNDKLYNKKIGLIKGYAYNYLNLSKFNNIKYFNSDLLAFNALNNGEIDLYPSNKLVGIHIIKKYFNDFSSNISIIKNENFTNTEKIYMISSINSKNKIYLEKFNNGLKNIKSNGIYQEILLKNQDIINPNISDTIKLVSNSSFPIVVASEKINSEIKYMLPTGTKAIVLEWSKHFREPGIIKFYDEMLNKTKVKIVNGPLKGKELYIENMYIQID